jgi:hypothetical protein
MAPENKVRNRSPVIRASTLLITTAWAHHAWKNLLDALLFHVLEAREGTVHCYSVGYCTYVGAHLLMSHSASNMLPLDWNTINFLLKNTPSVPHYLTLLTRTRLKMPN